MTRRIFQILCQSFPNLTILSLIGNPFHKMLDAPVKVTFGHFIIAFVASHNHEFWLFGKLVFIFTNTTKWLWETWQIIEMVNGVGSACGWCFYVDHCGSDPHSGIPPLVYFCTCVFRRRLPFQDKSIIQTLPHLQSQFCRCSIIDWRWYPGFPS